MLFFWHVTKKAGGKFSEAVRHTGGLKREKSTRTSAATSVTQDRNFSWLGHTHTRAMA